MKVAFNNFPLQSSHNTRGIGSYTRNLLAQLKLNPQIEVQEFSKLSEVKECDLIHYPYFDLFQNTLKFKKKFPTIVTIHDVTPLVFPHQYPPGVKGKVNFLLQKFSLKSVQAIITDSEASKKDIHKYLNINLNEQSHVPYDTWQSSCKNNKIFPIHLAAGEQFKKITNKEVLKEAAQKYHLPQKFVLYFGNVNWNKNLNNLAKACLLANIDLVLVGKSFESRENLDHPELKSFAQFLKDYSQNSLIHILGFIPEEDLIALINLSQAVLLPSFYEGFGLPILEAQSIGTPVITSNISSMPEVAGEGALFVDPSNVEEISQAVNNIIQDKKLRTNLIEKGYKNCLRFSWKKTTEETIKVYQYALSR